MGVLHFWALSWAQRSLLGVVVAVGQFVLAIPTGAMAAGLVATEPSTGSFVGLLCTTPWAVAFVLSWQQPERNRAAL